MKKIIITAILLAVGCFGAVSANGQTIVQRNVTVVTNGDVQQDYSYSYDDDSQESENSSVEVYIGTDTIKTGSAVIRNGTPSYIQASSGSAMLPLRSVAAAVSGIEKGSAVNISWDNTSKQAILTFNGKKIVFCAGSSAMTIDGKVIQMDNSSYCEISGGQMFIPLRALAQALDVNVSWNGETKVVTLYK